MPDEDNRSDKKKEKADDELIGRSQISDTPDEDPRDGNDDSSSSSSDE